MTIVNKATRNVMPFALAKDVPPGADGKPAESRAEVWREHDSREPPMTVSNFQRDRRVIIRRRRA
jgi:hypothetical protein